MRTTFSEKSYSDLCILSNAKKNFEQLGVLIGKTGKTIAKKLASIESLKTSLEEHCLDFFACAKKLYLIIDLTNILKPFANKMSGSEMSYISSSGSFSNAYKVSVGVITDGFTTLPFSTDFVFSTAIQDTFSPDPKTAIQIAKNVIYRVCRLFFRSNIIVVLDGAYASENLLQFCISNGFAVEVRMHANRVIEYKKQKIALKKILESGALRLGKKKQNRTIKVIWRGLSLYVTISRRIDKHGNKTHIFTAATYKAEPRQHAKNYKARWLIERFFRTVKQSLGLNDCQSTSFDTQFKHIRSVLLAYAKVQLYKLQHKLKTPEDALRRIREQFNRIAKTQNPFSVESLGGFMC